MAQNSVSIGLVYAYQIGGSYTILNFDLSLLCKILSNIVLNWFSLKLVISYAIDFLWNIFCKVEKKGLIGAAGKLVGLGLILAHRKWYHWS